MQAIDARLLRGAAVPTAVAGAIAVVLCTVLVGAKGLVGALLGSVITLAFFSVTIVVISRVAQKQLRCCWATRWSPIWARSFSWPR